MTKLTAAQAEQAMLDWAAARQAECGKRLDAWRAKAAESAVEAFASSADQFDDAALEALAGGLIEAAKEAGKLAATLDGLPRQLAQRALQGDSSRPTSNLMGQAWCRALALAILTWDSLRSV